MAKSGFGIDSVLRLATAPLPRPVQYALGSKFRFYFALICIAFAMFFGVIHFGWNNGRPSVTVDRQKIQEYKQDLIQGANTFQQNHPNSQLAPLVTNYLNNLPAANNSQPYNNGYQTPTNYNTPGQTGSHPMVYPQQPNYQQPLTGTSQQYRPNPYPNNQYQTPAYGQQPQPYANAYNQQPMATQYGSQPQYGTPGQANPYATQPPSYPSQYNQYPTSTAYPNSNPGYQNYGQPARTSVPQYSAPGYR